MVNLAARLTGALVCIFLTIQSPLMASSPDEKKECPTHLTSVSESSAPVTGSSEVSSVPKKSGYFARFLSPFVELFTRGKTLGWKWRGVYGVQDWWETFRSSREKFNEAQDERNKKLSAWLREKREQIAADAKESHDRRARWYKDMERNRREDTARWKKNRIEAKERRIASRKEDWQAGQSRLKRHARGMWDALGSFWNGGWTMLADIWKGGVDARKRREQWRENVVDQTMQSPAYYEFISKVLLGVLTMNYDRNAETIQSEREFYQRMTQAGKRAYQLDTSYLEVAGKLNQAGTSLLKFANRLLRREFKFLLNGAWEDWVTLSLIRCREQLRERL